MSIKQLKYLIRIIRNDIGITKTSDPELGDKIETLRVLNQILERSQMALAR